MKPRKEDVTIIYGRNIDDTLSWTLCTTFFVLTTFDVLCDLLRHTETWSRFRGK